MTKTLEAVFDGEVLRLIEPLSLEPNTRVRLTLEVDESADEPTPKSFLQTARELDLGGPPDWSENVDDYLYGSKRHSDG